MNFAGGSIAYKPSNDSVFLAGHVFQQAIAEFKIPGIVKSTNVVDLPMSPAPLQEFSTLLDRVTGGNPEMLNSLSGMCYLDGPNGPELLANAYEYYDAPGDNTLTTFAVRNATNVAGSVISKFFRVQGGAGHTSGWL